MNAISPTRVEATCLMLLLHAVTVGQLESHLTTQPVDLQGYRVTLQMPIPTQ
jgi:hypothetical protein